jgi:NADPH:quinone reductase-like Zn-dependent oxidoreductase
MRSHSFVVTDHRQSHLVNEEIEIWRAREGEVIIATTVSMVGVGTDCAIYAQGNAALGDSVSRAFPCRPGSAAVGHIIAGDVRASGLRLGQRVLFFGKHASVQYYNLSSSRPNQVALPVPEDLPSEEALLARFLRVAMLTLGALENDKRRVLVIGSGLIGLLAMGVLRHAGFHVTAVSRADGARARLARELADVAIVAPESAQATALMDATRGIGFDASVDAGGSWTSIATCARTTRPGGRVLLLGTPRQPIGGAAAEALVSIHRRSLNAIGLHEWARPSLSGHQVLKELESSVAMARKLLGPSDRWITDIVQPECLPSVFANMPASRENTIGVIVKWPPAGERQG